MSCCGCINQGQAGIVESLGKFDRVIPPGCYCINPTDNVAGSVSLKTQYMTTQVICPTLDNATVKCVIGVQFRVIPSLVHLAFYKLSSTRDQISSYIVTLLRAEIRSVALDNLFEYREQLSTRLQAELGPTVEDFGHEITDVLVLDIDPTGEVYHAIIKQKTNHYMRIANQHRTATERMLQVKKSEASAEADRLSGIGQAEATKAISSAFEQGMGGFDGAVKSSEVMAVMLMLQYFDMTSDLSKGQNRPAAYYMPPKSKHAEENNFMKRLGQMKQLVQRKTRVNLDDL